MSKEPLTALEVDAIIRFLTEKLQDIKFEREEMQKDFTKQFKTEDEQKSDSAMSRRWDIAENRGFYSGVELALKILESRELP